MKWEYIQTVEQDIDDVNTLLDRFAVVDNQALEPAQSIVNLVSHERREPRLKKRLFVGYLALFGFGDIETQDTDLLDVIPQKDVTIENMADFDRLSPCFAESCIEEVDKAIPRPITFRRDILLEILSFKALNQNWDGYEAIPAEVETSQNTVSLIYAIDNTVVEQITNIYPNPNGTITIEWEITEKGEIVLEVDNTGWGYYLIREGEETIYNEDLQMDYWAYQKLNADVSSLLWA